LAPSGGFAVAVALAFVAAVGCAGAPFVLGYAATLLPLRIDEFPCAEG